jgi:hypothetical protein
VKEKETGWTQMVSMRSTYNNLVGKPEGKSSCRRSRCRWGIILQWMLGKYGGKLWPGMNLFRIETNGGLLWAR